MENLMLHYKLQPISLLLVKTELKNHICNRFCGISCGDPDSIEPVLRKMLISAFWAIYWHFFNFFIDIKKFYQVLYTWKLSDQLDH